MTDQELIDEVADELGNQQIPSKIRRWLNKYADYVSKHFVCSWLKVTGATLSVTDTTNTYTLPVNVGYLSNVWTSDGALYPIDEQKLTEYDPLWNTTTGELIRYVLNHQTILFYRYPNANKTVYYSYQSLPTKVELGKTTEYTGFPSDWHDLLCQGAKVRGFKYEGNATEYATSAIELRDMMKALKRHANKRLDTVHRMEPTNRGSRPPRALLPSNYNDR